MEFILVAYSQKMINRLNGELNILKMHPGIVICGVGTSSHPNMQYLTSEMKFGTHFITIVPLRTHKKPQYGLHALKGLDNWSMLTRSYL